MKKSILLLSFLFAITFLSAQSYKSSAGLRLGYPVAGTYKMFINDNSAIEGIVGFGSYSSLVSYTNIRAAYLIHKDLEIESISNLQWYYGGGAGLFIWSFNDNYFGESSSATAFGLSGYIGLEYMFEDIPLVLSIDWAPTVILGGFGGGFGAGYGALSARYIINRG